MCQTILCMKVQALLHSAHAHAPAFPGALTDLARDCLPGAACMPTSGLWLSVCANQRRCPCLRHQQASGQRCVFTACFSRCWTGEPCRHYVIAWLPLLARLASTFTASRVSR